MIQDAYMQMFLLSKLPIKQPVKESQFYHILTGKRTASNLFQAHSQQLLSLFSFDETLSRKDVQLLLNTWLKHGWISEESENSYVVSLKGREVVTNYFNNKTYPYAIHAGRYGKAVQLFWSRLQLITQVLSNKAYNQSHYTPIIQNRSVQLWTKNWIRKQNELNLNEKLGKELLNVLQDMEKHQAVFIAHSLTGYEQIGLTSSQRKLVFPFETSESQLVFLNALYELFRCSLRNDEQSLLYQIAQETDKDTSLGVSGSTKETVDYIQNGWSPLQISKKRQLREGTIWEHLMEWSIVHRPSLNHQLIPTEIYQKIFKALEKNEKISYKELKTQIPNLPFAWFRLAQIERNFLNEP